MPCSWDEGDWTDEEVEAQERLLAGLERLVPGGAVKPPPRAATGSGTTGVIELIAGEFVGEVRRVWNGARIAEYLMAPDARRHLWHACFALRPQCYASGEADLDAAYRQLTFSKSKELALNSIGEAPKGLLKLLGKLGPKARAPDIYEGLIAILIADGFAAKMLRHSTKLPNGLIRALSAMPDDLRTRSVVEQIESRELEPEDVRYLCWVFRRTEALLGQEASEKLSRSKDPFREISKVMHALPFPLPPWSENETLVPITSKGDLKKVAERFENCLTTRSGSSEAILRIVAGDDYFYEWRGEQPALLQFKKYAPFGWYLEEIKGRWNEAVSERTAELIRETVLASGMLCPFRRYEDQRFDPFAFRAD